MPEWLIRRQSNCASKASTKGCALYVRHQYGVLLKELPFLDRPYWPPFQETGLKFRIGSLHAKGLLPTMPAHGSSPPWPRISRNVANTSTPNQTASLGWLERNSRFEANDTHILGALDAAGIVNQLQVWPHFNPVEGMHAEIYLRDIFCVGKRSGARQTVAIGNQRIDMGAGEADTQHVVGQSGYDAFQPKSRCYLIVYRRCAVVGECDVEKERSTVDEFAVGGFAKYLLLHAEPKAVAIMPL